MNLWEFALLLPLCACGARTDLTEQSLAATSENRDPAPAIPWDSPCSSSTGPSVVLSDKVQPSLLAALSQGLVWGEWHFHAKIALTPYEGGEYSVLAFDQAAVNDMRGDGNKAFYVTQGVGENDGGLYSADPAKPGAFQLMGSLVRPQGVAIWGEDVYVIDGYGPKSEGHLWRISKSGGKPVLVAAHLEDPMALAASAHGIYVLNLSETGETASVFRVFPDGGLKSLYSTSWPRFWLGADANALYFSDRKEDQDRLHKLPADALETTVIDESKLELGGFIADGSTSFWYRRSAQDDAEYGEIVWDHGSGPQVLAQGPWRPQALTLTQNAVYFSHLGSKDGLGQVLKVCRPSL